MLNCYNCICNQQNPNCGKLYKSNISSSSIEITTTTTIIKRWRRELSIKKLQLFNTQHQTKVHKNTPLGDKTIKKASQDSCYFGVREELGLGVGNSEASRIASKVSFFWPGWWLQGHNPICGRNFLYLYFILQLKKLKNQSTTIIGTPKE